MSGRRRGAPYEPGSGSGASPGAPPAPTRGRGVLSSRPAWLLLAAVALALLALGSMHGRPEAASARVAYLESVIKCPNCDDLTIAQSTSVPATHLRSLVVTWVGEGRSNAWIEQQVVDHYGSQELLSPPVSGLDALAWVIPIVVVVLAIATLGWFLARRRRSSAATASSAEDEALVDEALAALLARGSTVASGSATDERSS